MLPNFILVHLLENRYRILIPKFVMYQLIHKFNTNLDMCNCDLTEREIKKQILS